MSYLAVGIMNDDCDVLSDTDPYGRGFVGPKLSNSPSELVSGYLITLQVNCTLSER